MKGICTGSHRFSERSFFEVTRQERENFQRGAGAFATIIALLFFLATGCGEKLEAQQTSDSAPAADESASVSNSTPQERIAAIQLELANASNAVLKIVNQPVYAYRRTPGMHVWVSSPGWFHPGALKPNFNKVDVRKTQELTHAGHQYVTSDLNPGWVFLGKDLEFNSMTKYFYTNRTLPKHKLTEAEMLEINRLYRIIGHCESELDRLQNPAAAELEATASADGGASAGTAGFLDRVRSVPRETRITYGAIAIGGLLVIVAAFRFLRRKAG